MNRRGFFGRLLTGGAAATAALAPRAVGATGSEDIPDKITVFMADGTFAVTWLGWQRHVGSDRIWGAWVARDDVRDLDLYSICNGIVSAYRRGMVFDLRATRGRALLGPECCTDELAAVRRQAYNDLYTVLCSPYDTHLQAEYAPPYYWNGE